MIGIHHSTQSFGLLQNFQRGNSPEAIFPCVVMNQLGLALYRVVVCSLLIGQRDAVLWFGCSLVEHTHTIYFYLPFLTFSYPVVCTKKWSCTPGSFAPPLAPGRFEIRNQWQDIRGNKLWSSCLFLPFSVLQCLRLATIPKLHVVVLLMGILSTSHSSFS